MSIHAAQRALLVQLQDSLGDWHDVGRLNHANEITWFESSPRYWDLPERPVLGQVFEERGRGWTPSSRVTLPTWFSHLLPEGTLRTSVAEAVGVDFLREFFLLGRLGVDDLPGAVRVLPVEPGKEAVPSVSLDEELSTGNDEHEFLLKFSLAGVQPKFSVLLEQGRGLTIPSRGTAGDWIVKTADSRSGFSGVPRAEFGSLTLAKAVGQEVPNLMLVPLSAVRGLPARLATSSEEAFAIERFDRLSGARRVHAEVLAQVLQVPTANSRLKYTRANFETVASVLGALCGTRTVLDVIDRIVLNVLVGNGDAHLKNWAVVYPDGRNATLSPLFDVVPTVLYLPKDHLGLKLNGSRDFYDVSTKSFDRLAYRSGISVDESRTRVGNAVQRVAASWHVLADFLSGGDYTRLTQRRDDLPLFRSY